jgi:hypothetical protein
MKYPAAWHASKARLHLRYANTDGISDEDRQRHLISASRFAACARLAHQIETGEYNRFAWRERLKARR